jgi:hypothetical protein
MGTGHGGGKEKSAELSFRAFSLAGRDSSA